MAGAPKLSLIIPARSSASAHAGGGPSLPRLLDFRYEVLVYADGDDGTREPGDPRFTVFGRDRRGGKGRAIREGVAQARGRVIGFMDADYKTPIDKLPKFLSWIDQGSDVVIGSRVASSAPPKRWIAVTVPNRPAPDAPLGGPICPISNVRLRALPTPAEHSLELLDAGRPLRDGELGRPGVLGR